MVSQVVRMDLEVVSYERQLEWSERFPNWAFIHFDLDISIVCLYLTYASYEIGICMERYCYLRSVLMISGRLDDLENCLTVCLGHGE